MKNRKHPGGRPKGKPRTAVEIAADALRTGRPRKEAPPPIPVTMRLAPSEYEKFKKDAKRVKMSLSSYLRYCWEVAREGK